MRKKNTRLLRNNCKQLAWLTLGFVLCISLLEAKGFVVWANRLEVSTTQQAILRSMTALENAWSIVAEPVVNLRPKALDFLTEHGWSDMPRAVENLEPVEEGVLGYQPLTQTPDVEQPSHSLENEPINSTESGPVDHVDRIPKQNVGSAEQDEPKSNVWITDKTFFPVQPSDEGKGPLIPLPALQSEQSRHIVFAGDSMMAVGIAPLLQKELLDYKTTSSVGKAYRAATGLARPDVFDWQKEYPRMIGNKNPDVVIVAIGGNDTQNLDVNGKVLTIGSDEWKAVYEERLTNYLDMLTKDGAVVLWLKLPPMRPAKYNTNVDTVNEVAEKVVARYPKVIWWDTRDRFLNAQGKFQEFAVVPPSTRQVRIRQSDGIHMTEQGAKLISDDIINWLNLAAPIEPIESTKPIEVVEENVLSETNDPVISVTEIEAVESTNQQQ